MLDMAGNELIAGQTGNVAPSGSMASSSVTAWWASTAAARVESGIPFAYRLIRRGDGHGNMIPVLQGLFTWTESTKCGAEWRDLETQDEPHVEDSIPLGPINY
jgi:hypothetical protein